MNGWYYTLNFLIFQMAMNDEKHKKLLNKKICFYKISTSFYPQQLKIRIIFILPLKEATLIKKRFKQH